MKFNKRQLKQIIIEEMEMLPEEEEEDLTKMKTQSMSGSGFGKAGREDRMSANPELSNVERGIVQQIDQFLLKLAQLEGVELNNKKTVITRMMKMLEKAIVPMQQGATE